MSEPPTKSDNCSFPNALPYTDWNDDHKVRENAVVAARHLSRDPSFIDADGYQCEVNGAAMSPAGSIAYVEARSKDVGYHPQAGNRREIDVSIRIHLRCRGVSDRSVDIESYNPFFGCSVKFFKWLGDDVFLVYEEKHSTYLCRFGSLWPPVFVKVQYRWCIHGQVFAYRDRNNDDIIHRLSLPQFQSLAPLGQAAAKEAGCLPSDIAM